MNNDSPQKALLVVFLVALVCSILVSITAITLKPQQCDKQDFDSGERLYSHYLTQAGYRNGYVGKWHCGIERIPVDFGIEG